MDPTDAWPCRRQGFILEESKEGIIKRVTLKYLVLIVHNCVCRTEAHEQMAGHCRLVGLD